MAESSMTHIDFHAPGLGDQPGRQQLTRGLTLAIKPRAQQRPLAFAAAGTPGGRGSCF